MIIDCETHVFPYIDMPQWGQIYKRTKVEDLICDMDDAGVDMAFLMIYDLSMLSPNISLPDPNAKTLGENVIEYFIESWGKHKERFFLFHCTDPRRPNHINELENFYNIGLQGLGEMEPVMQGLMPNSIEYREIYKFAAEKDLPIVLTMEFWDQFEGYFPANKFNVFFDMYEQIIREFKSVRFMMGHGGNCGSVVSPETFSNSGAGVDHKNCAKTLKQYLETNRRIYDLAAEVDNLWICCCMPWWFQNNKVNSLLYEQLTFLKKHIGFEKVAWGTDWPWCGSSDAFCFKANYVTCVDAFKNISDCDEREIQLLLGGAAQLFLKGNVKPDYEKKTKASIREVKKTEKIFL